MILKEVPFFGDEKMISSDFFVEKLCAMTETKDLNHVIVWSEDPRGGYSAVVNNVTLHLSIVGANQIRLSLRKGMYLAEVYQPEPHISQAPIGKFLQRVSCSIAQAMDSSSDYSWPHTPSSPEEKAREQLRVALGRLWILAAGQEAAREELRFDETVRETLFSEVLRLKPASQ